MRQLIRTVKNLGIPNLLSIFRLILIPAFILIYFSEMKYSGILAAAVLVISGITDVLDGFIARRAHLVSELGRILDPLADKLIQITICICLVIRHTALIWVLFLLIIKELIMIAASVNIVRKGKKMIQSRWFGKLGTVAFYFAVIAIIAFNPSIAITNVLLGAVLGYMLFSLFMYIPAYMKIMMKKH